MSILISKDTRVLVQGITGYQGEFHTARMLEFGTRVVAGVTPGKGGTQVHGVPVFDTAAEAVQAAGATAACIFVPARFAKDAALEAIEARLDPVVVITEGVPVHDALQIVEFARRQQVNLVGPNCAGLTVPGRCKVGVMPNHLFAPGPVGVVSRSGTLTYEIVAALTREGIGQSAALGLGGDPVVGISFTEALRMFQDDPHTAAVILIGETEAARKKRRRGSTPPNCASPGGG